MSPLSIDIDEEPFDESDDWEDEDEEEWEDDGEDTGDLEDACYD